ncbi:TonB-dependent receptor [Dyella sp. A6]|uniref:TonB-dependent receptor n=1 Tax=Dyella aluminiiresistens TaxID=3069105 RepID=UPI002E782DEA|nr:TonB-dependent receptor [Dyella sp. A6]
MNKTNHVSGMHGMTRVSVLTRLSAAIGVALLGMVSLGAHAASPDQVQTGATVVKHHIKDKSKTAKTTTNLSAVTVTGMRASLMSAEQLKENAPQIVDSVTAVDIGALPDRSVTETLQRISGVTIDHFLSPNDSDHPSAEGSGVMIRGLTEVRGELNGRDIFSANSARGLSFQDVPAELMAGVDVYKNPSADIIEGGIGGTVNLRTRLPFDAPGRLISFNTGVNEGDMSKKSKPSASFLYSNRWKTENLGEMGALFDVAYSSLATRSDGIQVEPYVRRNDAAVLAGTHFSQVYVPGGADWRTLDFQRRRIGIAGAFQWRPNHNMEFISQVLRSGYDMSWNEHGAIFNDSTNNVVPAPGTTFQYSPDGVFEGGWLASNSWRGGLSGDGVRFSGDNRYSHQRTITTDWSNHFKWYLSDNWILSADFQMVKSTSRGVDFTVFDSTYLPGVYLDTSGSLPKVTVSPSNYVDNPANYFWSAAMDHHEDDRGWEHAARIDLEYDFDNSNWLQYVKFGVRATSRIETNKISGYNWGVITDNWATINSPNGLADLNNYLPGMSQLYNYSDFFRGNATMPSLYFANDSLAENYMAAYKALHSVGVSWGWTPMTAYSLQDINNQNEKTQAAYGIVFFGNQVFGIPFDGNLGLRLVRTQENAQGWGEYPNLSQSGVTSSLATAYTGQYFPLSGGGTYKNALPSLNLRFKLTHDLQWRIAASKAMARPDFAQLQPYLQLGATLNADNTAVTQWTGAAGNPNLKPMEAKQYDTALEWYFGPTSELYTTLFYKDISNYIETETKTENYNGQNYLVTRPYNNGTGTVRGAEFGYSQFFSFLPGWLQGLGVQVNYTYVKSQGGVNSATDPYYATTVKGVALPLVGLSKNNYNFIAMYDYSRWSARLAWNWRSRYLLSTSDASTHLPTWSDSYGQLDGSVFYHLNKHMQVGLQMNNLNNAKTRVLMGPTSYSDGTVDPRLYKRGIFVNDRRYELVFRATF